MDLRETFLWQEPCGSCCCPGPRRPPFLSVLCFFAFATKFAAQNIVHEWSLELAVRGLVLADGVQFIETRGSFFRKRTAHGRTLPGQPPSSHAQNSQHTHSTHRRHTNAGVVTARRRCPYFCRSPTSSPGPRRGSSRFTHHHVELTLAKDERLVVMGGSATSRSSVRALVFSRSRQAGNPILFPVAATSTGNPPPSTRRSLTQGSRRLPRTVPFLHGPGWSRFPAGSRRVSPNLALHVRKPSRRPTITAFSRQPESTTVTTTPRTTWDLPEDGTQGPPRTQD